MGLLELRGHREQTPLLAHLSRDCNTVEHVQKKFADIVENQCSFSLNIVDPVMNVKIPITPQKQLSA